MYVHYIQKSDCKLSDTQRQLAEVFPTLHFNRREHQMNLHIKISLFDSSGFVLEFILS